MDPRHAQGARAEAWAAQNLAERGWVILARNLPTPYAEVDLLAEDPAAKALVAVEVKARRSRAWDPGEDAVRPRQRARLGRALEWCALRLAWPGALRIDLARVELRDGEPASLALYPDLDPR